MYIYIYRERDVRSGFSTRFFDKRFKYVFIFLSNVYTSAHFGELTLIKSIV